MKTASSNTLTRVRLAARAGLWALCCLLPGIPSAAAAPLTWTIDSAASPITIAIPDQSADFDGDTVKLSVRNQTGSASSWNVGTKAQLQGTFDTNYVEGSSITFLAGLDTISGVNSGNFRPNPAVFVPDDDYPFYTNTSTAAAVFGGKFRATVTPLTVDVGYMAMRNVLFDFGNSAQVISGSNVLSSGLPFGISSMQFAWDGVSAVIPEPPVHDNLSTIAGPNGTNSSVTLGSITSPDPFQPNLRKLTIPYSVTGLLNVEGSSLTTTLSGTIVAYAVVPEPSTLVLAGAGVVTIASCARRRTLRITH